VVEEGDAWQVSAASVPRVCDRTMGVGSDGVVVLLAVGSSEPRFRLRMFNPDGGEFERSGNGLRILASYLQRTGRVRTGEAFDVLVGGDRVRMEVHDVTADGVYDVTAEMGRASVNPADVHLSAEALAESNTADGSVELGVRGGGRLRIRTVSVGNPHAVVFTDDLTLDYLKLIGLPLATHPAFGEGTNVQLARPVQGERAVEALVWERGVGHTLASGTSACAVAVASVASGRLPPGEVEIRMEGGTLTVGVTADLDVTLRGPVQEVATGEMTNGFLRSLTGS
jgi:diaminopimelate epimerase